MPHKPSVISNLSVPECCKDREGSSVWVKSATCWIRRRLYNKKQVYMFKTAQWNTASTLLSMKETVERRKPLEQMFTLFPLKAECPNPFSCCLSAWNISLQFSSVQCNFIYKALISRHFKYKVQLEAVRMQFIVIQS